MQSMFNLLINEKGGSIIQYNDSKSKSWGISNFQLHQDPSFPTNPSLFHPSNLHPVKTANESTNGWLRVEASRFRSVPVLPPNSGGGSSDRRSNLSSSLLLPRHPRPTQGTVHQWLRRLPCRRKAALFCRPCLAWASLPMAPCTPQPLRHSHFQALVQHHLLDLWCFCHYLHGIYLSVTFQFIFCFF